MLPGIGSSRAKSIFNYKIMLGGYTSIEQLKKFTEWLTRYMMLSKKK
ncbi:MAG: hypothetical protein IPJ79_04425 [Bacteroidetes bacterium]|nr:hypothetical protein [Bacteroidota bacterium]